MWGAPCGVLAKEIEEESAWFLCLLAFTLTDELIYPVTGTTDSSVDVRSGFFGASNIDWRLTASKNFVGPQCQIGS